MLADCGPLLHSIDCKEIMINVWLLRLKTRNKIQMAGMLFLDFSQFLELLGNTWHHQFSGGGISDLSKFQLLKCAPYMQMKFSYLP